MIKTHNELAHRSIDHDIDNIADELHDRNNDALADALDPHTEPLRALMHTLHDALCTDASTATYRDDDDFDIAAFDLDQTDAPCLMPIRDALSAIAYSHYTD